VIVMLASMFSPSGAGDEALSRASSWAPGGETTVRARVSRQGIEGLSAPGLSTRRGKRYA